MERPDAADCMQPIDEGTEVVARQLIGAAIQVHRTLGPGYMESVYESALCVELTERRVPFVRQHPFAVTYGGHAVGEGRIDLLIDRRIVVELKAVDRLIDLHTAQLISYLKAMNLRLGFLMNFQTSRLTPTGIKRIVR